MLSPFTSPELGMLLFYVADNTVSLLPARGRNEDVGIHDPASDIAFQKFGQAPVVADIGEGTSLWKVNLACDADEPTRREHLHPGGPKFPSTVCHVPSTDGAFRKREPAKSHGAKFLSVDPFCPMAPVHMQDHWKMEKR